MFATPLHITSCHSLGATLTSLVSPGESGSLGQPLRWRRKSGLSRCVPLDCLASAHRTWMRHSGGGGFLSTNAASTKVHKKSKRNIDKQVEKSIQSNHSGMRSWLCFFRYRDCDKCEAEAACCFLVCIAYLLFEFLTTDTAISSTWIILDSSFHAFTFVTVRCYASASLRRDID